MAGAVQPRCRITVVDDDPEFVDLMQELLSERYAVFGLSGLVVTPEAIADTRADLVMVDLHLGGTGLQGWEIVTLMRAHRYLRDVPIVVCTGVTGFDGRADRVLDTGNTALLYKPFSLGAIEAIISQGLSVGFTRRQLTAEDDGGAPRGRSLRTVDSDAGLIAGIPAALES